MASSKVAFQNEQNQKKKISRQCEFRDDGISVLETNEFVRE